MTKQQIYAVVADQVRELGLPALGVPSCLAKRLEEAGMEPVVADDLAAMLATVHAELRAAVAATALRIVVRRT